MNLYFDESIRSRGGFIVGALVAANADLSLRVRAAWTEMGFDPNVFEYKSSALKIDDPLASAKRDVVQANLFESKLALAICPDTDRRNLGLHCVHLVLQLYQRGHLTGNAHELLIDEGICIPQAQIRELAAVNVAVRLNQDSRIVAGLQIADHAAHALGGMLLEEMGLIRKLVRAGANSGYHPEQLLELGFELWAGLRYSLIGNNEHIPGLSPHPDDPANPYFRVDGHGLYIAPTCSQGLADHARQRFGINYLGCIH